MDILSNSVQTLSIFNFDSSISLTGGENIDSDKIEDMIEKGDLNAFTHKIVTIILSLIFDFDILIHYSK